MNFEPTEEQHSILAALDRLLAPYRAVSPTEVINACIYSSKLAQALEEAGFYDAGARDADASATAALIVAEIAKLPVCVEVAATLLVRPHLVPQLAGVVALVMGAATSPARFLPQAAAALVITGADVRQVQLEEGDVEPVESVFAYPMGRLTEKAIGRAHPAALKVATLLQWWRIGVALEAYGALSAAHQLTISHVSQRMQFGRPIGSMQAIQHRLAMDATAIESIRWLALRAACSHDPADAALAAAFAQQAIKPVVYDLHQFSGAMGLTTEYPLHLFTYRARALQSELGGYAAQILAAADALWPTIQAVA